MRARVATLREQSLAVQEAVERSQHFWRAMLAGLPEGCHLPLSPRFWWRRRVHCAHQGPQRLRELPSQPKSATAAVAAPRRTAHSPSCFTSSSDSSSASSRARASQEAARRDVPAARARACRLSDEDPRGGTGASSSLSRTDFDNSACRLGFSCLCPGPGYLQFSSSSATTACASDTVADLKSWAVARR